MTWREREGSDFVRRIGSRMAMSDVKETAIKLIQSLPEDCSLQLGQKGTMRSLIRSAGLTVDEFLKLL